MGIEAAPGDQLRVTALLYHHAPVHHDDPVRVLHGGQAVGNDQGRPPGHGLGQGELDQTLVLGVQGAGGLVEQQDRGVAHQGPGNGDPLALPTGQGLAPLAQGLVEAVRQGRDEACRLRRLGGLFDLGPGRRLATEADIVQGRAGEQGGILRHQGHAGPYLRRIGVPQIDAVKGDDPGLRIIEPQQEPQNRALPRAGGADQGHGLPRPDIEGQAVQGG